MRRKYALLCLVLIILGAFSGFMQGCNNEPTIPEYELVRSKFTFSSDGGYFLYVSAQKFQSQSATYYFGLPSNADAQRLDAETTNACIYYTEKILDKIGLDNVKIVVLPQEEFGYVQIDDNTLIVLPQNWKSAEYMPTYYY